MAKKKYKSMKSAALALKRKGVNMCDDYFSLKSADISKVVEVMESTSTFRRNHNSGKSAARDFFDRMAKYSTCKK